MASGLNHPGQPGLRGDEAIARWRIRTGMWGGRVLALVLSVPLVVALVGPGDATLPESMFSLGAAAAALLASEGVRRGSRTAAVVLLAGFIGFKIFLWLIGYAPLLRAALLSAVLIFCLAQGVWGTLVLARVRRDLEPREGT